MPKLPIYRAVSDDYTLIDNDGEELNPREGEWVKFKKKLPGRLVKLLSTVSALDAADDDADQRMGEAMDQLVPLLSKNIVGWNWTDLWTGEPLPEPSEDAIWDLDIGEIFYLAGKLSENLQSPKAPS